MNRFCSGFMRWVVLVAFVAVSPAGCGGGGSSGGDNPPSDSGGGNLPGGGGDNTGNPSPLPPTVVSAAPQGEAVSVGVTVEMTFDKSMDVSSFQQALTVLEDAVCDDAACNTVRLSDRICTDPACQSIPFSNGICTDPKCRIRSFNDGACGDAECKTIRFGRSTRLGYDTSYVAVLSAHVKEAQGAQLASPYKWSFKTEPFVPPPSFKSVAIDGLNGDAGECTALAIDSSGTIHIVYYSESDGSPKHAFCPSTEDCSKLDEWHIGFIESPDLNHKRGRDINLAVEQVNGQDLLHVSYRDVDNAPGNFNDGKGILKYARGAPDQGDWKWTPTIVEDTAYGVTDTHVAVRAGRVHISYRRVGGPTADTLAYAVCQTAPCDSLSSWHPLDLDRGSGAGAPNHIVVTETAIHISYYLGGMLKYVTCLTLSGCEHQAEVQNNWKPIIVDDGGRNHFDVGTENSLAVDGSVIHITYRDNTNGLLKYARCAIDCADLNHNHWEKISIDAAGGSSQIKVADGLHVSYRDDANKDLKYATCSSDCLDPNRWSVRTIDALGEVGLDTYLEIKDGVVHISYRDAGNKDLKYASGSAGS